MYKSVREKDILSAVTAQNIKQENALNQTCTIVCTLKRFLNKQNHNQVHLKQLPSLSHTNGGMAKKQTNNFLQLMFN